MISSIVCSITQRIMISEDVNASVIKGGTANWGHRFKITSNFKNILFTAIMEPAPCEHLSFGALPRTLPFQAPSLRQPLGHNNNPANCVRGRQAKKHQPTQSQAQPMWLHRHRDSMRSY